MSRPLVSGLGHTCGADLLGAYRLYQVEFRRQSWLQPSVGLHHHEGIEFYLRHAELDTRIMDRREKENEALP